MQFTLIVSIYRGNANPDTVQWLRNIDDLPLHDIRAAIDATLNGPIPQTDPPQPPLQSSTTHPTEPITP